MILHTEESDSIAGGVISFLPHPQNRRLLDRRRNVHSSVADLRILYANQMQNLHAQIEGSAKFVPMIAWPTCCRDLQAREYCTIHASR
jgi:hypothetical protein